MKKLFIIVLCLILCIGATACGKDKPQTEEKENVGTVEAPEKEDPKDKPEEKPEEKEEVEEPKTLEPLSREPKETVAEGDYTITKFWKAALPKDWIVNEDTKSETDNYSYHVYGIKDGDDFKDLMTVSMDITATPYTVRQNAANNGFDVDQMIARELPEFYNVCAAEGYLLDEEESSIRFRGRDAAAKASVYIEFAKDARDEAQKVLDTFVILAEDQGNVDPPAPKDGVRFDVKTSEAEIEGKKVSLEYIELPEPFNTFQIFNAQAVEANGYLYVENEYPLKIYKLDNNNVTLEKEVDFEHITRNMRQAAGKVFLNSSAYRETVVYEGLDEVAKYEHVYSLAIHPQGEFGFAYNLSGTEIKRLDFKDNNEVEETMILEIEEDTLLSMFEQAVCLDEYLYIYGKDIEADKNCVVKFDFDGNVVSKIGLDFEDSFYKLSGMVETENGYIIADGNLNVFIFTDKEGKELGRIKLHELYNTNYPNMGEMSIGSDGKIYIAMTEERPDNSCREMLVFRLNSEF